MYLFKIAFVLGLILCTEPERLPLLWHFFIPMLPFIYSQIFKDVPISNDGTPLTVKNHELDLETLRLKL